MLLLDAVFINNGGGKVLLDYLIGRLLISGLTIHYLLDDRIKDDYIHVKEMDATYVKASLLSRHKFYRAHRGHFEAVFCFGNLPPAQSLDCKVSTYFHQRLFIEIPSNISKKQRFILKIKSAIFKRLISNTDVIIVQTKSMEEDLKDKFPDILNSKIMRMPFYPSLVYLEKTQRDPDSYIYVSSGSNHKNHSILLDAFESFSKLHSSVSLKLTVGIENSNLISRIENMMSRGVKITNYPNADRSQIAKLLNESTYCIYPSLSESLGLTIIEAIENGCSIIGADLPYMYEVCKPSLTFDPLSSKSLENSLLRSQIEVLEPTVQYIEDQIEELIDKVFS